MDQRTSRFLDSTNCHPAAKRKSRFKLDHLTIAWRFGSRDSFAFFLFGDMCALRYIPSKGQNGTGTETVEHEKKEIAINFDATPRGSMRRGRLKCLDGGPPR